MKKMPSVKRKYYDQWRCWWWLSSLVSMSWTKNTRSDGDRCGSDSRSRRSSSYSIYRFLLLLTLLWSSEFTLTGVMCYGSSVMSPRVVFTKQGPIQGFLGPPNTGIYNLPHLSGSNFNMRQYGGRPVVEIFSGIPYSKALRYESPAPAPIRSRTEVYNANVTKPPCPRTMDEVLNRTSYPEDAFKSLRKTMSLEDDCLFLNIYAPLNSDKSDKRSGLAVLVYMNSHMDDPGFEFDGSSVAAIGNIIVISVRYRTGVLGFLQPSFSEDVRSNFGLWDMLAALQWIQVTLSGYDLDANIAGLLALSPVSQAYNGLFHRLILINGSPFAPNSINNQPLKTTYQLARALRCPLDERTGDLASCLRKVPVPQLITAAEKNIGSPLLTYPFSPIVDGTLVPNEINQKNGPGHSQAVKDMLGKYDLLCGLKEGPVISKVTRHLFNNIDMDRFITAAIKLTMNMESGSEPTAEVKGEVLKAIIQMYGTAPPMRELISDFLMVYPVIDLLNTHSNSGKNTFFYVFQEYDPLDLKKHDEISYIFSSNVYRWKYTGNPSHVYDLHPFVLLINLLANFVRSGDPNVLDPSDRFPNPIKSWPKFREDYGRYLAIAKDIQFPSGYRKASTDFWGKTFPSILKSFTNHSAPIDPYGFPPYIPRNYNSNNNNNPNYDRGTGISVYPGHPGYVPIVPGENGETTVQGPGTESGTGDDTGTSPIIAGGQSTVVLVGCLLLILNFLCFMGLFYQRERLKKAEIQLRKRYIETQKQQAAASAGRAEGSQDVDDSSFAERIPPNHLPHHHHHPHPPISRDAMSETETENGFGPDFLGPNYDPRTKVNRWMQMQNANRMLSKGNSFEEYSNPTPTPSDMNRQHRLSRVREDENIYETAHHMSPIYQMGPSPHMMDMSQLSYPSMQQQPPLQIQVNSLQRPKQIPLIQHHQPQPPKAQPETPVQFIPQLPYQEPYRPSGHLGSDIPYADSRATSPSVISAPAGFSNAREAKPGGLAPLSPSKMQPNQPQHSSSRTPSTPTVSAPGSGSRNTTESPKSTSILVTPGSQGPKRSSTLIVRDLDPPDEDSEPKYVAVKTGTLKRSVGVDTDHDNSPATGPAASVTGGTNNGNGVHHDSTVPTGAKSPPHSQIRVTFKENL